MHEYGLEIVCISLVLSFYYMTSLWSTTFVYTTFYLDTLKTKGGAAALVRVHFLLFFPPVSFSGTSFPALMHLVFKALKHTASVNTK